MYSRCINGKREVKAVILLGNIKDLNDKIWKKKKKKFITHGMNNFVLSKKAVY